MRSNNQKNSSTVMKTIIIKELKLLAAYAVLIMIGMSGYAAWCNHYDLPSPNTYTPAYGSLLNVGPLAIVLAPFVAFFFGFWQNWSENMTGKGSFLRQRPVSTGVLYWAKFSVGIGLTAIVSLIPFTGQELWRIYSDRFPMPAHWEFGQAGVSLLISVSTWAAGLMVATRPVKWWGSRLLPVFAVLLTLLHWAICFTVAAVFLIAAYQVFFSQGDTSRMTWPGRLTLGTIIGIGGTVVAVFFISLLTSPFDNASSSSENWNYSFPKHRFVRTVYSEGRQLSWNYLNGPNQAGALPMGDSTQITLYAPEYFGLQSNLARGRLVANGTVASYLDNHVFKQYDLTSGRLISVLGENGFKSPQEMSLAIPFSLIYATNDPDYIVSPRQVIKVDYRKNTLAEEFSADQGEQIVTALSAFEYDGIAHLSVLPLFTSQRIVLLDGSTIISSWASRLPFNVVSQVDIDRRLMVLWLGDQWQYRKPLTAVVLNNGKVIQESSLLNGQQTSDNPLSQEHADCATMSFALLGTLIALHQEPDNSRDRSLDLIIVGCSALISVVCLQLVGFRLDWSANTKIVWVMLGIMFGPATVFAALGLFEWPVKVSCTSCGKKRLVTQVRCPRCGEEWTAPVADGHEIFDGDSIGAESLGQKATTLGNTKKKSADSLRAKGTPTKARELLRVELQKVLLPLAISILVGACYVICKIAELNQDYHWYYGSWPKADFTNWIFSFCVVSAIVIAVGQFLSETRSEGMRTFTLQRPIVPSTLFLLRMFCGFVVYILVVGLAVGTLFVYSVTPGHQLGPFPSQGALLGLQDCVFAFLFWFGVAIAMVDRGPWYGRRIIPLFFCVGAVILGHNCDTAIEFVFIAAALYALLLLTAWGRFVAIGETRRMPSVTKFTSGLILAGAALFVSFSLETVVNYIVQGNQVAVNERLTTDNQYPTTSRQVLQLTVDDASQWKWREPVETFQDNGPEVQSSAYAWYVDTGRKILLCYNIDSKILVGYVDGSGWHEGSIEPNRWNPLVGMPAWGVSSHGTYFEAGDAAVYKVNTNSPGTTVIYRVGNSEKILCAISLYNDVLELNTTMRIVLLDASNDHFRQIASLSRSRFASTLAEPEYATTEIGPVGFGTTEPWVRFLDRYHAQHNSVDKAQLFRIRSWDKTTGKVAAYQFGLTGPITPYTKWDRHYSVTEEQDFGSAEELNRLIPLSFGIDGVLLYFCGVNVWAILSGAMWPTFVGTVLSVLLSRRLGCSASRTVCWTIGAMAFGLYAPAFIVTFYLWPVLVDCQTCGKKRRVTDERCEHCGVAWLPSNRDGQGIFEQPVGVFTVDEMVGR